LLRVVGIYATGPTPDIPDPIPPGGEDRLLFSLNLKVINPMADTLCGYAGRNFLQEVQFSNSGADLLTWEGHDGAYRFWCYECGDANSDGLVNISDAVRLVCWIFGDCDAPEVMLTADPDCSGFANITDAVYMLTYIFAGGPAPCKDCPEPELSNLSGHLTLSGTKQDLVGTRVGIYNSLTNWNQNPVFSSIVTESGTAVHYYLPLVSPGNYYLDAWKDNDEDGEISAGDYFGAIGIGTYPDIVMTQFVLPGGVDTTIDIELNEVPEHSLQNLPPVNVLDGR